MNHQFKSDTIEAYATERKAIIAFKRTIDGLDFGFFLEWLRTANINFLKVRIGSTMDFWLKYNAQFPYYGEGDDHVFEVNP